MTLNEVLSCLTGVTGRDGQYMARCPAHDDRRASLSVSSGDDGRILLKCQAGCSTESVAAALGLSLSDLFPQGDSKSRQRGNIKPQIVATYAYKDAAGKLLGEKLRYSDKHFSWRKPVGNSWEWKKPGNIVPYNLQAVLKNEHVYLVEGEKYVDTITAQGRPATCSPDGAGPGKWKSEYSEWFKGKTVFIIPDNDEVGRAFAQEEAEKISAVAQCVKVLDLCAIWPELPEHGDTTDLAQHMGAAQAMGAISKLAAEAPNWAPEDAPSGILACFKTLDVFEEQEAEWLVPGWIPQGQITLLAADGGVGKTSLWVHIIAKLSAGQPCILDPPGHTRQPLRVAFMTTEDSIRQKLKKKLRIAWANMKNIIAPDFLGDTSGALQSFKFGSADMASAIRYFKPALCVFDPVQGFVPPLINMGSRNAMRDCTAPLITLGEECGTTSLIVSHTNKRKGASGRDRIADSADLWDVARSVIMAGYTEEQGARYLSNEKNNYAALHETLLFSIDGDGQIIGEGTTWKRDRDFMQAAADFKGNSKREDCKEWLLHELNEAGGAVTSKDLSDKARAEGYSADVLRRAKDELKRKGEIHYYQTGSAKAKTWHVGLTSCNDFQELSPDTETPF